MTEQSYAVYKKHIPQPTIKDLEEYLFSARTKGAQDKTKVVLDRYNHNITVNIPENAMSSTYATPAPKVKGGIPTFVWLIVLILAIVLGILV